MDERLIKEVVEMEKRATNDLRREYRDLVERKARGQLKGDVSDWLASNRISQSRFDQDVAEAVRDATIRDAQQIAASRQKTVAKPSQPVVSTVTSKPVSLFDELVAEQMEVGSTKESATRYVVKHYRMLQRMRTTMDDRPST